MSGGVRHERVGAALLVTIDRPERRNAIDGAAAQALEEAFRVFEGDDGARVLVLTGAGEEAFCAGADLHALESLAARVDAEGGPLGISRLAASKPTIAAVGGWCVAGGLELALWCDLRIVASGSRLGFTERRFGVPLIDGGTQRLPRIVGLGRALDLILSGRLVDAHEALAMGLVTEVVPAGLALQRALQLAEGLAALPQTTMLADREAIYAGLGLGLREGLELEARSATATWKDALEGAARFAAGEGRGAAGAGL